jgi:hypothetical protein
MRMFPMRMLCLIFATAVLSGLSSERAGAGDLAINPIVQQAPAWCWAAAAQMVLSYYGFPNLNPSGDYQCGVVSAQGGFCSANCAFCLNSGGSNQHVAAVIQAYAQAAGQRRGFINRNFRPQVYGILPPDQLIRSIDNNSPVLAGISPTLGIPPGLGLSQHAVVIVGYSGGPSNLEVLVNDPYPYAPGYDPYSRVGGQLVRSGQYRLPYASFVNLLRYGNSIVFS